MLVIETIISFPITIGIAIVFQKRSMEYKFIFEYNILFNVGRFLKKIF